ncbi:MAG: 2TM domain-containing protein [Mycobacterium sp.]|nr:2TM domain-containing protein [Mycobacterium sp.]
MTGPEQGLTEVEARKRAKYLTGLLWHTGAFVIVNGFFWVLDAVTDGGITWAFWITLFWGFALAFHALAYLIDGRQLEARKTAEYLQQEESGDQQD